MKQTKKEHQTLQEFLLKNGVGENSTSDTIEVLKKQYYRRYHKEYYQERKEKRKRVELRFTNQEYSVLKQKAVQEKKALATYLKEQLLHNDNIPVYLSTDEKAIHQLRYEINAIGNNINQVVYAMHGMKNYHQEAHYKDLLNQIVEMRNKVQMFLTKPPKLMETLKDQLLEGKLEIGELRALLDTLEQQKSEM